MYFFYTIDRKSFFQEKYEEDLKKEIKKLQEINYHYKYLYRQTEFNLLVLYPKKRFLDQELAQNMIYSCKISLGKKYLLDPDPVQAMHGSY